MGEWTLAGWALDRLALSGAGIGAVHAWAFPATWAGPPIFLGATTPGGPRPDVAAQHGPHAARAGWTLTAPPLPPGEYEVVAYFWSLRTGRFDDARTIRVVVR